jgi:signal transduction histidine kinase
VVTVKHELFGPMTWIIGHAELLEDFLLDLPQEARGAVAAIVRAGEKLADLAHAVTSIYETRPDQPRRLQSRNRNRSGGQCGHG